MVKVSPGGNVILSFSDGVEKHIENTWNDFIYIKIEDRPEEDAHYCHIKHPATEMDYQMQFDHRLPECSILFQVGDYISTKLNVTTQKELNNQAEWEKENGPLDNPNAWFKYVYQGRLEDLIPDGVKAYEKM